LAQYFDALAIRYRIQKLIIAAPLPVVPGNEKTSAHGFDLVREY